MNSKMITCQNWWSFTSDRGRQWIKLGNMLYSSHSCSNHRLALEWVITLFLSSASMRLLFTVSNTTPLLYIVLIPLPLELENCSHAISQRCLNMASFDLYLMDLGERNFPKSYLRQAKKEKKMYSTCSRACWQWANSRHWRGLCLQVQ